MAVGWGGEQEPRQWLGALVIRGLADRLPRGSSMPALLPGRARDREEDDGVRRGSHVVIDWVGPVGGSKAHRGIADVGCLTSRWVRHKGLWSHRLVASAVLLLAVDDMARARSVTAGFLGPFVASA